MSQTSVGTRWLGDGGRTFQDFKVGNVKWEQPCRHTSGQLPKACSSREMALLEVRFGHHYHIGGS